MKFVTPVYTSISRVCIYSKGQDRTSNNLINGVLQYDYNKRMKDHKEVFLRFTSNLFFNSF